MLTILLFYILQNYNLKFGFVKLTIFLKKELKLELHPDNSRLISLSRGTDFVGFRNFYYYRLLRARNVKNIENKIQFFKVNKISYEKFIESFQGWNAYAKWADSYDLTNRLIKSIV